MKHEAMPTDTGRASRIILERNGRDGWRVLQGPHLLFVGGRVKAKKQCVKLCQELLLPSWFNRKDNGLIIEIPLTQPRA